MPLNLSQYRFVCFFDIAAIYAFTIPEPCFDVRWKGRKLHENQTVSNHIYGKATRQWVNCQLMLIGHMAASALCRIFFFTRYFLPGSCGFLSLKQLSCRSGERHTVSFCVLTAILVSYACDNLYKNVIYSTKINKFL